MLPSLQHCKETLQRVPVFAVFTNAYLPVGKRRFAAQARERLDSKLHETTDAGSGNRYGASVVAGEKRLRIFHDGLKNAEQGLAQLMLEVKLSVDGNIVL